MRKKNRKVPVLGLPSFFVRFLYWNWTLMFHYHATSYFSIQNPDKKTGQSKNRYLSILFSHKVSTLGRDSTFTLCHAPLKKAILLHKRAIGLLLLSFCVKLLTKSVQCLLPSERAENYSKSIQLYILKVGKIVYTQ